jgi:hypothetical protein
MCLCRACCRYHVATPHHQYPQFFLSRSSPSEDAYFEGWLTKIRSVNRVREGYSGDHEQHWKRLSREIEPASSIRVEILCLTIAHFLYVRELTCARIRDSTAWVHEATFFRRVDLRVTIPSQAYPAMLEAACVPPGPCFPG